jgi:small-conductance mechanosensitive channel
MRYPLFSGACIKIFVVTICILISTTTTLAQKDSTNKPSDTIQREKKADVYEMIAKGILSENRDKFQEKQKLAIQKKKVNQLRLEAKNAEDYFQRGIDTNHIKGELSTLETLFRVTTEGITTKRSSFQSSRNLISSEILLVELIQRLGFLNKSIGSYKSKVDNFRKRIDSIATDSALYYLPADTSKLNDFITGFASLSEDLAPADKMLNEATSSLSLLEKRAAKLHADISLNIFTIDTYREDVSKTMLAREMPGLMGGDTLKRPLKEVLSVSIFKARNIFLFFIANNIGAVFMILLLFLLLAFMFRAISIKVSKNEELFALHIHNEIVEHPILSSLFIVLNTVQFFFVFPPFAIQAMIWIVLSVILIFLHRRNPGIFTGSSWIYLLILFLLAIIDNLILEASQFERIALTVLTFASCLISFVFLRNIRKYEVKVKIAKIITYLFLFLQAIAFISLLLGRYNLGKTLFTGGYIAIIAGVFLYWTYQLLVKALNTYSITVEGGGSNMFLRLQILHDKTPGWASAIFVIGWAIIFLRNFYFYTRVLAFLNQLLSTERTIGKFSYSLESILVFVMVIFLSGLASKFISFLAGDPSSGQVAGKKKGGLSNWLLLIRLTILVLGILLAFASAGIPMDRLTIILGSLSLGIGFGLQTIVNNLISGVILAVERPIEIGDQIEVAGKTGNIKEIGIRSSKLINFDGAEVIIPNGDLLSEHVINWTLSNSQRRVELIIGVKYGSDLEKAKQILQTILLANNKVERVPEPQVLLHQFSHSSIDLRLLFWSDISIWINLKSEIIFAVYKAFKEAGIEIPYPQQDVYIKELPRLDPK